MGNPMLHTRVEPRVKTAFETLSKDLNYSSSAALVRALVIEAITKYPHLDSIRLEIIKDLHRAIDRLRRNLNQIATTLNGDDKPPDDEILAALEECRELIRHSLSAYGKLIRSTRQGILK